MGNWFWSQEGEVDVSKHMHKVLQVILLSTWVHVHLINGAEHEVAPESVEFLDGERLVRFQTFVLLYSVKIEEEGSVFVCGEEDVGEAEVVGEDEPDGVEGLQLVQLSLMRKRLLTIWIPRSAIVVWSNVDSRFIFSSKLPEKGQANVMK